MYAVDHSKARFFLYPLYYSNTQDQRSGECLLMDGDFELDVEEILTDMKDAEVLSIFFPMFRKSLVLDFRTTDHSGPMVKIMPMVASPQERMRAIRRLRPGFPRRHSLSIIAWPRYVGSLESHGIWQQLIDLLKQSGHKQPVAYMSQALNELKRQEKAELARVVMGDNYRTIWTNQTAPD